jgi:integrase/recombinase XerD
VDGDGLMQQNEIIIAFDADLELRGMSDSTRKTYISMVKQFSRHLDEKGKSLIDVGKPELKDWLRVLRLEQGLRASSLQGHFSALSALYDYLQDDGIIRANPVLPFRKRNLHGYKKSKEAEPRKLISVDEAAKLVRSVVDSRDRAIILLLLKTGIRRHELAELDVQDLDLMNMSMKLKETPKRSNRIVFFDEEAMEAMIWWLEAREKMNCSDPALFVGNGGRRLNPLSINRIVIRYATRVGLHIPGSNRPEDRFTAHCCRHWFTSHLDDAGIKREYIQFLRGDIGGKEAVDGYIHPNLRKIKENYLAHIPRLGV